jgi:hypothetical protein
MQLLSVYLVVIGLGLAYASNGSAQEAFPELRPTLKPPTGYSWTFKDGPDFYTWVLAEGKKQGAQPRSGIGIYFGLHPNLEHIDKKVAKQLKGTVCSQEVTWWVQVREDRKWPRIRRDVAIRYPHGKGFKGIQLHFWVWGTGEEQVAELAKHLKTLRFAARDK